MKYRCSIFCLHTVLFLVKYTWVCLFGWSEEYSLIVLNEKEFHRIYYTMMVLVLIGKKREKEYGVEKGEKN